jgi:hypothetical protein
VAVRCPECGKLEIHPVYLFDFRRGRSLRISCACGAEVFTLGARSGGQYWLQVPCYLCDRLHFIYYGAREFWSPEVKTIFCPEADIEMGFFGAEEEVRQAANSLQSELEQVLGEAVFEDFFDTPEIMCQALSRVYDLAATGNLVCSCGNSQVEADIFPDRLELHCNECRRWRILFAETDRDLSLISSLKRIELGEPIQDSASRRGAKKT